MAAGIGYLDDDIGYSVANIGSSGRVPLPHLLRQLSMRILGLVLVLVLRQALLVDSAIHSIFAQYAALLDSSMVMTCTLRICHGLFALEQKGRLGYMCPTWDCHICSDSVEAEQSI